MSERSVEDRLRQEYFELLPDIRRVIKEVEAEVRYSLLPITRALDRYEQFVVKSRIKACESALDALRRRQEGRTFDQNRPELYSLKSLNDLAGVRVLVFPRRRAGEADGELRERFPSWTADPIPGWDAKEPLATKYFGYCAASGEVAAELQIVPMLTALFWEVEHAAIDKPSPRLTDVARHPDMQQRVLDVLIALAAFEDQFEGLIQANPIRGAIVDSAIQFDPASVKTAS